MFGEADFHSHGETTRAMAEFIDDWYDPERRHSTLGIVSPIQYERQLRHADRAG